MKLPGPGDYALLTALGVIWGLSFTLIKIAVATIPSIPLTLTRVTLTALLLYVIMRWMGERLPPWGSAWWPIFLSALLGNSIAFLMIAWGQEKVDGSMAAILMSPSPLAAVLLAHIFTHDDKLNRWKLAGVGLGIVGIAVLMGLHNLSRLGSDLPWQLLILAAGCCYGANVVVSRWLTGGSMVSNMTAVMMVSGLILLPFGLVPGVWSIEPSRASVLATLLLILLSTTIGNLMLLALVRRAGPAFAGQVNFLVPVFGVIAGTLILAERPTANAIAGLALVLVGVAVARRGAGLAAPTSGK